MRPLRLEVEGFTSFRDRACLDFSGLDLFAITGPTGAGKSSLIDAMVLALYGQVPRVGDRYKQLISHGADRMSVCLDFQVGAERYRVARTIRDTGACQVRLERLVNGGATGLADRVKDIHEQIERIVGLDYDAFIRSVVLPQGQFDAFLKGKPDERRRMLVSLLNLGMYERMHAVVNRQASEARREAEFVAGQVAADFDGVTPEALAARQAELAQVEEELTRFERAVEALDAGLAVAQGLRMARRDVEALSRELQAEDRKKKSAETALGAARNARGVLDQRASDLEQRLAGTGFDEVLYLSLASARPTVEALSEAVSAVVRLTREHGQRDAALEARKAELGKAESGLPDVEARATSARSALEAARASLDDVRMRHAAHAIRARLKRGDPCPVCERPLEAARRGGVPGLDQAEDAVVKAEGACEAARRRLESARLEVERLRGAVERVEGECRDLKARATEARTVQTRATAALQQVGFTAAALEQDQPSRVLLDVGQELKALEQARSARERLISESRALERERAELEQKVVAARSQAEAAAQRGDELAARRREAQDQVARERQRLARMARRESWEGLEEEDGPGGDSGLLFGQGGEPQRPGRAEQDEQAVLEARRQAVHRCLAGAHARQAGLQKDVAALTAGLARVAELREKKRTLEARAALANSLAQHLQANQFLAYVQEEALRVLAEDGSRHMNTLSQGRYSIECEGQDFCVLDHWNGDLRRSVKTLSGGETFLASLSLALALAGRFADLSAEGRSGEALQSLFLDEGFGTLDAEALEVVVSAIEALQGGERMIGVVTHIPELAERLPGRVQVSSRGGCASLAVA